MPQENVTLAYRALDAFNRRDVDAFLALMDDDVEAEPLNVAMEGGLHGQDGMRRWWENVLGIFPDWNGEVVEVRDLGDLTVGALHLRAHGADSDVPLDQTIWMAARWRRGKCVWWRTFNSRDEALEAVGLSEQDAHADS